MMRPALITHAGAGALERTGIRRDEIDIMQPLPIITGCIVNR